jgi:hypothetical protein
MVRSELFPHHPTNERLQNQRSSAVQVPGLLVGSSSLSSWLTPFFFSAVSTSSGTGSSDIGSRTLQLRNSFLQLFWSYFNLVEGTMFDAVGQSKLCCQGQCLAH